MQSGNIENTFKIYNQNILLRDMCIEDVEDYIVWNTTEIEWQDWDAPWEKEENINIEELKSGLIKRLSREVPKVRRRLEICTSDEVHIGWVSSYYINDDKTMFAIGIDIPSNNQRGKKLGESAFSLFLSYLLKSGEISEIYTQTWSGNDIMISLAKKCGFEIVDRKVNYREVEGTIYDGLTFRLNKELFWLKFNNLK